MNFDSEVLQGHLKSFKYTYILICAVILLNFGAFLHIMRDWVDDSNYSHGFFVIPISVFLLWRARKELAFPAKPSRLGAVLFGFGSLIFLLGTASSEFFTTRVSLLIMITGIAFYSIGYENFKKVWFAFAFLIFMIPLPSVIYYSATVPMQLFASKVSATVLQLLGVPLIRHGNILQLPGYALEVVEACSGLRSLVTLMALSAVYGHLTLAGKVRPILLFIAAIPIAIVTNIFRLIISAFAAYTISIEFAEGFLHELAGIIVFAISFVLIIITGAILKWTEKVL